MNDKQQAEINFWRQLVHGLGKDRFIEQRKTDFQVNTEGFGGKLKLSGKVLEVGSGLFSQLEWVDADIYATDPLMDEYINLLNEFEIPQENVTLVTTTDEHQPFSDNEFDCLVCWNVIDHTPNPQYLADEMYRVLKPGGKLYFEVHFDDSIAPPHYSLWREDTVTKHFSKWKQEFGNVFRNPHYPQSNYYAIFRKDT